MQYDRAGNILPQEKKPYYQEFEENRVQEDAEYFYLFDNTLIDDCLATFKIQ